MIAYAVIGIILGFPLIILAGLLGGVGGFIHGRINRAFRQRERKRREQEAARYRQWVRSQR